MKLLLLFVTVLGLATAQSQSHQMQHGFILSVNDQLASHLVASGHHSRQTEITGALMIEDPRAREFYARRKAVNGSGRVYFLFQAQNLNLPTLSVGQILRGPIVESRVGEYDSKNIIVKDAKFKVQRVLLNLENPFFHDKPKPL